MCGGVSIKQVFNPYTLLFWGLFNKTADVKYVDVLIKHGYIYKNMAHHFVWSLHLRSQTFYIYNHVALIMFFSEIVPWALKPQIIHMLLLWGQQLLSISALLVGGTWWISEHCSFHLLTTEIARGCWQVPDKHGLLHGSPWSTFSIAPWIHHQPWQHTLF